MSEEVIEKHIMEEYAEYWTDKGVLKAQDSKEYQKISEDIEKNYKMILDMALPWQRKLIASLIDEIKNLENARSSMEMDTTINLIYNSKEKEKNIL